jgi:hypothetical protein
MDHPEVREWITAAVAAPGGLTGLVVRPTPETAAILDHLRDCAACMAEWRAWSAVSLGLAAAAPDDLAMRPASRAHVLGVVTARPRATMAPGPTPPVAYASSAPTARPSVVPGGRSGRTAGMTSTASRTARRDAGTGRGGTSFRWLALGAAAAALLFVAGAVLGRPLGLGGGEPARTSDASRILAAAADVLQGQGHSLAHLETPDGTAGGFVAVSPGSGRLVVVSRALTEPSDGARYLCYLERDGTRSVVGPMHFDGDLAYWAGRSTPTDLGLTGDVFLVQLDTPGSEPALSGTF